MHHELSYGSYAIGYVFLFGISVNIALSMSLGEGYLCHGIANQNMCMGQSSFLEFNSVQNYIEQTMYF